MGKATGQTDRQEEEKEKICDFFATTKSIDGDDDGRENIQTFLLVFASALKTCSHCSVVGRFC